MSDAESNSPVNEAPHRLLDEVRFGADVVVHSFVNLYGCEIGDRTRVGTFVEIQRGARIGAACKIQSHSFICDGVRIEDEVFVGHGVVFVNDKRPRATNGAGELQDESRLGAADHDRRARGDDRLRRDHPRRRPGRAGGDGRSRRGGHQGRRAGNDGGRQSRASAAARALAPRAPALEQILVRHLADAGAPARP